MTNQRPYARDYWEHAVAINKIAGNAINPEAASVAIAHKASIGLSFQSIELAGKAILRALGWPVQEIKSEYRNHRLLELLRAADRELIAHPNQSLKPYHRFLLETLEIRGQKYGNTVASYLEKHFAQGNPARPRNYFYPDEGAFTGPVPIDAIYFIADYLNCVASDIIDVLEKPY